MSSTHVIKQFEIFYLYFTIVVLIIDTYSDYKVAIRYLLNGETTSFISIICLMLISSLINVLISREMQQRGDEEYNSTDDYCKILHLITKNRLFLVIAIPLKLAPIVNYWKTSKYAIKALKYKKSGDVINESRYHKMMLKKYRDASLLRILECYLDAAPQQILQLTLMLNSYDKINFELFSDQVFSTFLAFIYMGASMAEYNKVIRFAQEDKLNIGGIAEILQLLWHFCITAARILSLGIIASIWPISVIICCIIHWIGMTIWIWIDPNPNKISDHFCRTYDHSHMQPSFKKHIYSVLFASVFGIVYIFIYINTAESNTVWRYVSFYILCFLENTISNLLWANYCPPAIRNVWYFNKFHIISFVFFGLGIIVMVLYYKVFHPSKKNNINRVSPNVPNEMIELETTRF